MYYIAKYFYLPLWAPSRALCLAQSGLSPTQAEWINSIRMSLNAELKFEVGIRSLRNMQDFYWCSVYQSFACVH